MHKHWLFGALCLLVLGITACASGGNAVAPENLPSGANLKKGMTDGEFAQAYKIAAKLMVPYTGLSLEKKIEAVAKRLYDYRKEAKIGYSDTAPHYNDVYGFFVSHVSSCAGATRAVNILGIPYTHMNENQWDHQWCRVKVGKTDWICDVYAPRYGPEANPIWAVTVVSNNGSRIEWKTIESRY
jgi:hypothetical protein